MDSLPIEIISMICDYMSTRSVLDFSQTCKEYLMFRDKFVYYLGNRSVKTRFNMIGITQFPAKYISTNIKVLIDIEGLKHLRIVQGVVKIKGYQKCDRKTIDTILSYSKIEPRKIVKLRIDFRTEWQIYIVKDNIITVTHGSICPILLADHSYVMKANPIVLKVNGVDVVMSVDLCAKFIAWLLFGSNKEWHSHELSKIYASRFGCAKLKDMQNVDFEESRKIRKYINRALNSANRRTKNQLSSWAFDKTNWSMKKQFKASKMSKRKIGKCMKSLWMFDF